MSEMRDDTAIDRVSIKHADQQVAGLLAAHLSRLLTVKLRSERDLAEELGVPYITVRHALAILRDHCLIPSIYGRGTFIAS